MAGVTQERLTCRHRGQNAGFALLAQIVGDAPHIALPSGGRRLRRDGCSGCRTSRAMSPLTRRWRTSLPGTSRSPPRCGCRQWCRGLCRWQHRTPAIRHWVPCRVYSNSRRSTWAGFIGRVSAARSNALMPVILGGWRAAPRRIAQTFGHVRGGFRCQPAATPVPGRLVPDAEFLGRLGHARPSGASKMKRARSASFCDVKSARTSAFSWRPGSGESSVGRALAAGIGLPPRRGKEGIRMANRHLNSSKTAGGEPVTCCILNSPSGELSRHFQRGILEVAWAQDAAYAVGAMDQTFTLTPITHTHVTFDDGIVLECGAILPRLTVAYRTYGTLNAARTQCGAGLPRADPRPVCRRDPSDYRQGRLVGDGGGAGPAGGHRPLLRHLRQCAGRLHGLHRSRGPSATTSPACLGAPISRR